MTGAITRASLIRVAIVFVPLVVFPLVTSENATWVVNIGFFTLMYAGLATAWNLIAGYTGYVTLGNMAFFGLGAYGVEFIFQHVGVGGGWWPFALVPALGLVIALVSIPIGWIAYRTRALSFIILTIVIVIVFQYLALNLTGLTGGSLGMSMPAPPFAPGNFERIFYFAMLVLLALSLLACWYVRRSRLGLMMFAIRDDEDKAAGIGVNVTATKLIAFAASAGLSAMIGVVWAYYLSTVYPQFAFDAEFTTIAVILMGFLGGIGTLWGPFIGALILAPAQQYMAFTLGANDYYLIAYAAVFVLVMLTLRRGVVPSINDWIDRRRRRSATKLSAGPGVAMLGERVEASVGTPQP